ncbi:SURF1 family cytochrome oxidase biogenesis protein [Saccharothrix sp. ST-888]|uniref:SURF1 family cytochrome oxidase biogenesis protein n=1 Tax=Saccharothrix sp. ST-888 TaxID=1427391 RepID=UPI0005EC3FBD|nr:SURF1 family protein [Saccharothrix sp. ST-888]KJK57281.1 membrane protein [Saccharothrix sp. ST-888]
MYRFLLSRRWAIITLIVLLLIPTMVRLGFWQLHRHEARVARNQLIATNLQAAPVPFDSISSVPGFNVPTDRTWQAVTASGQYDAAHEFVIRSRLEPNGTSVGFFVITPLKLADGKGEVLVNRGWVDSPGDATSYPTVPGPPSGEITLTGRMRADETTASSGIRDRGGLPPRQFKLINSTQQAKENGTTVLGGYLELVSTAPAPSGDAPELLPEPEHSDIGPHMAYAIQWWLFAALVPVGMVILARREAKERAAEAAKPVAAGTPDPDPEPDSDPEPESEPVTV